ncbi:MAG: HAMP domain-containing sensor histidine kinase [bacterium]|nr:HAMP domain-containing sensor histidine kinase [bacterium]
MRKFLRFFRIHRLRIVEQVVVVAIFSLIIPLIVTGIIVNNINRQALARELRNTALIIAKNVDRNIYDMFKSDDAKIKEIALSIKYLPNKAMIDKYLSDYVKTTEIFSDLHIERVNPHNLPDYISESGHLNPSSGTITVSEKLDKNHYLIGIMNKEYLHNQIFKGINEPIREIFVISEKGKLVSSINYNEKDFQTIYPLIPSNMENGTTASIGKNHNQPIICTKMKSMDVTIIVNTTTEIMERTIYFSAWQILTAMIVSAIASLLFISMYLSYLYLNIRQLFKGINALTKGNYSRKIRLLKNILTPYELVYLANEFNKAADEINDAYSKLAKQKEELEILDNFRSNLIDTVSHEFRTPLTSIKGYSSRLMRTDITIDKATWNKSLKVIKQQTERLSRMIEDLLVIPDIEGAHLNMTFESVNLAESLELSLISVKNIENREVINNVAEKNIHICADKDRFEQVLINIIENANKYGMEDTPLVIDAVKVNGKVTIILKNYAPYIDKQTVKKLFEKFVRLDDKTTRTTRGTGLGLFIVKGLLSAMGGTIFIKSTPANEFFTYITLPSEEE